MATHAKEPHEEAVRLAEVALYENDRLIITLHKDKYDFLEATVRASAETVGYKRALEIKYKEVQERNQLIGSCNRR